MNKKTKISDEDKSLFRETVKKQRIRHTDKFDAPQSKSPVKRTTLSRKTDQVKGLGSVKAEEKLFYAKSGLQAKSIQQFKRGQFPIEARVDLHGHTTDEAYGVLSRFLSNALSQGYRSVLVIHGKGQRIDAQPPILKNRINYWLRDWKEIIAFCSAKPKDGGTGAVYVLLANRK